MPARFMPRRRGAVVPVAVGRSARPGACPALGVLPLPDRRGTGILQLSVGRAAAGDRFPGDPVCAVDCPAAPEPGDAAVAGHSLAAALAALSPPARCRRREAAER